jgi:hypothetical protein
MRATVILWFFTIPCRVTVPLFSPGIIPVSAQYEFFQYCHLFKGIVDIGALLGLVPFRVTHAHEKAAGCTFDPCFVKVRILQLDGGFSAAGADKAHSFNLTGRIAFPAPGQSIFFRFDLVRECHTGIHPGIYFWIIGQEVFNSNAVCR